jgi:lysyl endopeptidase
VMKIAFYNTTITKQTFLGSSDWKVVWANGTVEPGSSGGPLFNSDKRIIGQVHGGNTSDICTTNDKAFFGRLDVSWTGGGTNSTRLSNWLDPGNTGAMTTNARLAGLSITGPSLICSSGQFQATGSVTWSSSNSSGLSIDPNTGAATRVNNFNGSVTVTATPVGCSTPTITKNIWVGKPEIIGDISGSSSADCSITYIYSFNGGVNGSPSWTWEASNHFTKSTVGNNYYLTPIYYGEGYVSIKATNTCGNTNICQTICANGCETGLLVFPGSHPCYTSGNCGFEWITFIFWGAAAVKRIIFQA